VPSELKIGLQVSRLRREERHLVHQGVLMYAETVDGKVYHTYHDPSGRARAPTLRRHLTDGDSRIFRRTINATAPRVRKPRTSEGYRAAGQGRDGSGQGRVRFEGVRAAHPSGRPVTSSCRATTATTRMTRACGARCRKFENIQRARPSHLALVRALRALKPWKLDGIRFDRSETSSNRLAKRLAATASLRLRESRERRLQRICTRTVSAPSTHSCILVADLHSDLLL